ncbi:hypothetical protein CROQUDRAFT_654326 [Cronartium quercuum f. sp. fusiforme G11]|uniref:Uncharacterized protein n=1 Tax=Cronartium quercuum f. sp. fusiforme G11 TaxID=708437 RepID=A0A9P6NSY5_9BASI|nr:hypothetical protein CROQUDRAFT_654326 [Cronartium quercuum f. sp. fusiforme G11]
MSGHSTSSTNHFRPRPVSQRPVPGLLTTLIPSSSNVSSLSLPLSDRSVTNRLQRLRLENRRHEANLLRTRPRPPSHADEGSLSSFQLHAHLHSALKLFPSTSSRPYEQAHYSTLAGPPPPPSWLPEPSPDLDIDLTLPVSLPPSGLNVLPPSLLVRQAILRRTSSSPRQKPQLSSLLDTCLRRLAFDLSHVGTGASFHAVTDLSEVHKQRLMELASEWAPLDDHSFLALFPPPDPDSDNPAQAEDEAQESWETDSHLALSIVTLDLSFSSVNLPTLLCSLFVTGLLRAPWLTSLRLDHAPHIALSTDLFALLGGLPLTHLSLAAQKLDRALLPSLALPRLASSTPSLEVLDLSYNPGWADLSALRNVDWHLKWLNLNQLVVVGNCIRPSSTARVVVSKSLDSQLRSLFKTRLEKNGKWIQCVF